MRSITQKWIFFLFQGKFVRIHFGTTGKIAGADIETCKYFYKNHLILEPVTESDKTLENNWKMQISGNVLFTESSYLMKFELLSNTVNITH